MKKLIIFFIVCLLVVMLISIGCSQEEQPADKTEQAGEATEEGEETVTDDTAFTVKSNAFSNEGEIPAKYANTGVKGGDNVSPPISWENTPDGTKSFVVAMIDEHPIANNWVHWAVIDIPADIDSLEEGASGNLPVGAKELNNTFGESGYGGPQPPAGSGAHDYVTTVYALNVDSIDLSGQVTASQLEDALQGKILSSAELTGTFER